jgi:hypothetical protein
MVELDPHDSVYRGRACHVEHGTGSLGRPEHATRRLRAKVKVITDDAVMPNQVAPANCRRI